MLLCCLSLRLSEEPICYKAATLLGKMALLHSVRCPENACEFTIIGQDVEEFTEHMNLHKRTKHTNYIGRLPNEILIVIIGYVVPDCEDCFKQRNILKLCSVSKRFNELVKAPDFYREIKMGYCDDHPSPPMTILHKIMRTSGSQLKNIKCKLKVPFISLDGFPNLTRKFLDMVANKQEHNLTALTCLEMQTSSNGGAKVTANMRSGTEPLITRIQSLRIDAHDNFGCGIEQLFINELLSEPVVRSEYFVEPFAGFGWAWEADFIHKDEPQDMDPETAFKNLMSSFTTKASISIQRGALSLTQGFVTSFPESSTG